MSRSGTAGVLGELPGELSNRPVGDRRLDRWRARAVACAPLVLSLVRTHDVLGVAAGLLVSFLLVGRAAELAAAPNAVLDEQRRTNTLAR